MTLESFRIRLRRIAVSLELHRAGALTGDLLCPKQLGEVQAEELLALLSADGRFLPFFHEGKDQSILINREHVVSATLRERPLAERASTVAGAAKTEQVELSVSVERLDEEPSGPIRRPEGKRRPVRLVLADDQELSGQILVSAPLGHTRTQDVFNECERFVYFEADDERCMLINLAYILLVADAELG